MRRVRRMLAVALLFLLSSCAREAARPNGSPSWQQAPEGELRALARLGALADQNPRWRLATVATHADGRFAFLRARYSEEGRLGRLVGIAADGRIGDVRALEEKFQEDHRAEWGVIGLQTATKVLAMKSGEKQVFALLYSRHDIEPDALSGIVTSLDSGAVIRQDPDVAFVSLDRDTVKGVAARLPVIRKIIVAGIDELRLHWESAAVDGDPLPHMDWPNGSEIASSTAVTTNSDTTYNSQGAFGLGVRVGIIEVPEGFGIDAVHEAFGVLGKDANGVQQYPSVVYAKTPGTCTGESECPSYDSNDTMATAITSANPSAHPSSCPHGSCVSLHGTAVASRIAATQRTLDSNGQLVYKPFHASQATLYVANNVRLDGGGLSGTPSDIWMAFDWLSQEQVHLVNVSLGGAPGFDYFGFVQDWFARMNGTTFVRSSGNDPAADCVIDPHLCEVECANFNSVCVGVVKVDLNDPRNVTKYVIGPSLWVNPYQYSNGSYGLKFEWEKPDVVAEGAYADIAVAGADRERWSDAHGSSFSAPTVTGVLAMREEYCKIGFGELDNRVWLRTSATWVPNTIESTPVAGTWPDTCPFKPPTTFPAPFLGCDHRGGAGVVVLTTDAISTDDCDPASSDHSHCGRGPLMQPCVWSGVGITNPNSPSEPIPTDMFAGFTEEDMQQNSTKQALRQTAGDAVVLIDLAGMSFSAGTRIRFAFAYNSCPVSSTPSGNFDDIQLAVNFDVLIYGTLKGQPGVRRPLGVSESLNDSNEGFDITLREDLVDLVVLLVRPPVGNGPLDWKECDDKVHAPNRDEAYAYRLLVGGMAD